jgi:uncharacterized membrane-anchored protein
MPKFLALLAGLLTAPLLLLAQTDAQVQAYVDSVNQSFTYQTGTVSLHDGIATLTVPKGFKYLDPAQSKRVITSLWGNPADIETDGLLFPATGGPIGPNSWAFNISYDEMGFVKDDEADEINYDELLTQMQEGMAEESVERVKGGYASMKLIGWAAPPFYDKDRKVLHWAKELEIGDSASVRSLNYDVRLLGRKGVLSLNAVGEIGQLPMIKTQIPGVLNSVAFSAGNRYADFSPSLDKVAAVGIGGLVAGKVLAKVGLFAVILKFWKIGLLALAGLGTAIRRFFGGKGEEKTIS